MSKLAILGGDPVIARPLAPFNRIGEAEKAAVNAVMDSGVLSGYIGAPGADFHGGPMVRRLEAAWKAHFGVRHAVSVNSATSGLVAAIGAAGVGPGDEVIVPPYTMSATAMAPLAYGGIPVFADIEEETFCLDPECVQQAITSRTKAIVAVNLFGHPARLHELRAIADANGLILIEDNAQGPLATEAGRFAGTIGHIGVFSLNRHKHIQSGEGGICVSDDAALALRLELIRNHGENLVESENIADIANLIGFNLRLSELSAAVAVAQLDRVEPIVAEREAVANRLSDAVRGMDGVSAPVVRAQCRHVYYLWAPRIDPDALGVSRAAFAAALQAEGVPVGEGYVRPLYHLPLFQRRIALGGDGFPFSLSDQHYPLGLCPVCEDMHFKTLVTFVVCSYELDDADTGLVCDALQKVYAGRDELRSLDVAKAVK